MRNGHLAGELTGMRKTKTRLKGKVTPRTQHAYSALRSAQRSQTLRKTRESVAQAPSINATRSRRKFLRAFPGGFRDETYIDWERAYKWNAHLRWQDGLGESAFRSLISRGRFQDIATAAIRVEARTNLLFSFEKMALRDAVRTARGARGFATALFDLLHGKGDLEQRFGRWIDAIDRLPRRQTRVLTWPLVTVFGFIAQPQAHFFFKPTVTREAARRYGVDLAYASRPSWELYAQLLRFVRGVRNDIRDLRPRDMIDMQSFLWVQGSDEYPD
jgi:hypothetical protein